MTEVEILEGLDFEHEEGPPTCDYTDCEDEATHAIVCGICGVGRENMCGPHTIETVVIKREMPNARLTFDNTCGHDPFFETCDIEPLS